MPLHALMFEIFLTHVGIKHLLLTVSGEQKYFACSTIKTYTQTLLAHTLPPVVVLVPLYVLCVLPGV